MTRLLLSLLALSIHSVATIHAEKENLATSIEDNRFPVRVHVFEDYETDIEKRWWLRGKMESEILAPSRSASVPNKRACRATTSKNFDRKMGDQDREWKAVIFNPVPGPPMGPRTRLKFRYWLKGTTTLRVQIYSLSKNYHRFLTLKNLPTENWQEATVDMTAARRPDGSGGALAEDERIDDIQFYIDPAGELIIDDIVLYEAAPQNGKRAFPRRIIFTGWFDTGEQGKEWPGEFEIVPHEKPRTWDAARSVPRGPNGAQTLRVHMRGPRVVGTGNGLVFRYKLTGGDGPLQVSLTNNAGSALAKARIDHPGIAEWSAASLKFDLPDAAAAGNLLFTPPPGTTLEVDDLLLFEK